MYLSHTKKKVNYEFVYQQKLRKEFEFQRKGVLVNTIMGCSWCLKEGHNIRTCQWYKKHNIRKDRHRKIGSKLLKKHEFWKFNAKKIAIKKPLNKKFIKKLPRKITRPVSEFWKYWYVTRYIRPTTLASNATHETNATKGSSELQKSLSKMPREIATKIAKYGLYNSKTAEDNKISKNLDTSYKQVLNEQDSLNKSYRLKHWPSASSNEHQRDRLNRKIEKTRLRIAKLKKEF